MSFVVYPSTQTTATPKGIWLFDVDGTLIVSKSGRRFGNDNHDWVFLGAVPQTLNALAADGWSIALVSNQSDWKRGPESKSRLEGVLAALMTINGWAPWLLIATAARKERDVMYRKPGRGLFDVLMSKMASPGPGLRMTGDAVGPDDIFPPYRWASSDREFAVAIGAEFSRPCDIFPACAPFVPAATQELVILMGNAGSGKTTTGRKASIATTSTPSIVHIEQDTVGTPAAVRRAVLAGLNSGNSVIIDATHGSAKNREPWIVMARDRGIPCRILWHIRDGRAFNSLREKPVPEVAYAVYSKYFVEPFVEPTEGIVELVF